MASLHHCRSVMCCGAYDITENILSCYMLKLPLIKLQRASFAFATITTLRHSWIVLVNCFTIKRYTFIKFHETAQIVLYQIATPIH